MQYYSNLVLLCQIMDLERGSDSSQDLIVQRLAGQKETEGGLDCLIWQGEEY